MFLTTLTWNPLYISIKRQAFSYSTDLSPATTTYQQTSRSSDVSSKSSVPSVPTTFSLTTSKAPEKDDVTTNEPESLDLYGHDIDSKWKIAFGVCLAIIIILLAGTFSDKLPTWKSEKAPAGDSLICTLDFSIEEARRRNLQHNPDFVTFWGEKVVRKIKDPFLLGTKIANPSLKNWDSTAHIGFKSFYIEPPRTNSR